MAAPCYLVTRMVSPYTERTLILGVFSKRTLAVGARRLYIQYASSNDSHGKQGYMRVNLEDDVVVTPYVMPDVGSGPYPEEVLVCMYEAECMGQVVGRCHGVFATSAGVAKYYAAHPPDTTFMHSEFMVPLVMDSLVKEPRDYFFSGHRIRPCPACHRLSPLWAAQHYGDDDTRGDGPDEALCELSRNHREDSLHFLHQLLQLEDTTCIRPFIEEVQPKTWLETRCAWCCPEELLAVCVAFVALLHKLGRHAQAVDLTRATAKAFATGNGVQ